MSTRRQHGFTLWELLMALLVAGILLGIGVPNVMQFQRNAAMTAAANDLLTAALVARTEAVKRQTFVTLCLTDEPMEDTPTCTSGVSKDADELGFVVWVDENDNFDANDARILTDGTDGNGVVNDDEPILMRGAAPGGSILISSNCGHASFAPTGALRGVTGLCAPTTRAVLFCDDRGQAVTGGGLSSARVVRVDRPGRALVLTEPNQITESIDTFVTGGLVPTCPL